MVSIALTWGFFAYSKQLEVVILMLLMKQKMFLGVSSVVSEKALTNIRHGYIYIFFFFCGGGGLIFVQGFLGFC